jgi:hypothetical protein
MSSYKTTFVTCLFDCHKNNGFDKEASKIYFKNSLRTLFIEQPLVIYCDDHYVEKYYQIRKALGYENITVVISKKMEDLFFYKYKEHIESFKKTDSDEKFTPEIYIVWFSRFKFMLEVMEKNYFNSTYFSWIDINLLSKKFYGSLNYIEPDVYDRLNHIAENPRDKFAIQMINTWTPKSYKDLDHYFSKQRWIVAGCFYTTDIKSGNFIIPKIIEKTEELLNLKYCQSDECVFAFIIDEFEEYFNLYIGDYQDTIHNYYTIEGNYAYVDWVISRNIERGNKDRVRKFLLQYKEYYLEKNMDFPYEHFLEQTLPDTQHPLEICEEIEQTFEPEQEQEPEPFVEIISVKYR